MGNYALLSQPNDSIARLEDEKSPSEHPWVFNFYSEEHKAVLDTIEVMSYLSLLI